MEIAILKSKQTTEPRLSYRTNRLRRAEGAQHPPGDGHLGRVALTLRLVEHRQVAGSLQIERHVDVRIGVNPPPAGADGPRAGHRRRGGYFHHLGVDARRKGRLGAEDGHVVVKSRGVILGVKDDPADGQLGAAVSVEGGVANAKQLRSVFEPGFY